MSLLPSLFLPSAYAPSPGDFTPPNREPFSNGGNLETGNFGQQWTRIGILPEVQPELSHAVVENRTKYGKHRLPKAAAEERTHTLSAVEPSSTASGEVFAKNKKKYQKFTRFLEKEQRRKSTHVIARILQEAPASGQQSQSYSGH